MNYEFPWASYEIQIFWILRLLVYSHRLKRLGHKAFVSPFARIENMQCVSVGDHSVICRGTLVQAVTRYKDKSFDPSIVIGNNVYIGRGCTISCAGSIVIGDDVTIGDGVYIGSGRHGYEDPGKGVLEQPLVVGAVRIGAKAWLGYGSVIAGNIDIGEHAVVGANSVVTRPVEKFTVVAGAPAKSIKKYNEEQRRWIRTQS